MSQKQRLKTHLESGQPITRLSALTELGIFELSSRIGELESEGFVVDKQRIKVTNRWNETITVTQYTKK